MPGDDAPESPPSRGSKGHTMPYICLARSDIADGALQVLDLLPNSSQAIPSLNPPGESRYVDRVKTGTGLVLATGYLEPAYVDGLCAYLISKVEPGGTEQAAGTITVLAGLAAGEIVTINGVDFTAVAGGANPALQQFNDILSSGSIANTVASLVTAITDAASIAAMKLGTFAGSYAHAIGASPVVNLTARKGAGATLTGWAGDMTLAISALAHMSLSGARMARTHGTWTVATQAAAAAAIVARLDAGMALALSNINTALSTAAGADLTGTTSDSRSVGSVADILAILAGRTWRIYANDPVTGTANRYMDATYPTFKWNNAAAGAFTFPILTNGLYMSYGEVKPATVGGDTTNREVAGIRHTYNVDALTASLIVGQLRHLTTTTLLWPSSNVYPHFPFGQAGFTEYNPTTAARLVTVYDDDGTVLG